MAKVLLGMVSPYGDPFSLRCNSCPARKLALGLAVVVVAACILLWVLLILFIKARSRASSSSTPTPFTPPCRYTFADLRSASRGFSEKNKLDEDRSNPVYRGTLSDGSFVSIKKLTLEGLIKEPAFASEIETISRVRHQHLLPLRGFCYENGEALLVYEYMPFSLHHYLFGSNNMSSVRCANGEARPSLSLNGNFNKMGSEGEARIINGNDTTMRCTNGEAGPSRPLNGEAGPRRPLNGEARLKILRGIGAALVHLHENRILHRDVKARNVMLTDDLEPRLGDFGVARLIALKCKNKLPTSYTAPEVVYTGKATEKADVYSFGALALEVASGRPAVDGQFRLIEWVWMLHLSNKLMDTLDPSCMYGIDEETSTSGISLSVDMEMEWKCVLHVALLCCNPLLEARPTMRQVAMVLEETILMPLPACMPTFPNLKIGSTLDPA